MTVADTQNTGHKVPADTGTQEKTGDQQAGADGQEDLFRRMLAKQQDTISKLLADQKQELFEKVMIIRQNTSSGREDLKSSTKSP